jgi:hypothetical protein
VLRTVVARTLAVLLVAVAWSPRPVRADAVVGMGTADSCTEVALDSALAGGGKVTFNCGGAATITDPRATERPETDSHVDSHRSNTAADGADWLAQPTLSFQRKITPRYLADGNRPNS